MRALILFLFMTSPIFAQSLDSRYEKVGTFDGMVGTETLLLVSVNDLEKKRHAIKVSVFAGHEVVNIGTQTVKEDGTVDEPYLIFTVGPLLERADTIRTDIMFYDETGYYMASIELGNASSIDDLVKDDTSISFSVDAELQPAKLEDGEFKADPERSSLQVSGSYSGSLPEAD